MNRRGFLGRIAAGAAAVSALPALEVLAKVTEPAPSSKLQEKINAAVAAVAQNYDQRSVKKLNSTTSTEEYMKAVTVGGSKYELRYSIKVTETGDSENPICGKGSDCEATFTIRKEPNFHDKNGFVLTDKDMDGLLVDDGDNIVDLVWVPESTGSKKGTVKKGKTYVMSQQPAHVRNSIGSKYEKVLEKITPALADSGKGKDVDIIGVVDSDTATSPSKIPYLP